MLNLGEPAPKFEFEDQNGKKFNFPADFKGKWLGLIFLRHLGCPLCLEKIAELKKSHPKYQEQGVEILVVVQSTLKRVKEYAQKKALPFPLIGDHERKVYELYGVSKGGLGAFLAPSVMVASLRATLKGNFHGKFEGDELQKPAVFIINPGGNLVFSEYGKNIADVISEANFWEALASLKSKRGT